MTENQYNCKKSILVCYATHWLQKKNIGVVQYCEIQKKRFDSKGNSDYLVTAVTSVWNAPIHIWWDDLQNWLISKIPTSK